MKALIVTYFFNDDNMGAIRLKRIVKYLPQFGIQPTVLTGLPEDIVVKEVPGVEIVRVKALDLKAVYDRFKRTKAGGEAPEGKASPQSKKVAFTAFLNRWVMIPDKMIPWRSSAVKRGRELLDLGNYDLIFTSLAPATNLLVAGRLAKDSGLPCVMEYRDLWNDSPYLLLQQPTFIHRWLHRFLERKALSSATRLSAVCRGIQSYLKNGGYGGEESDVELNRNFFDPDEYPQKRVSGNDSGIFTIVYVGAMYAGRTPWAFFRGLKKFIDARNLSPREVRFKWVGHIAALPELEGVLEELELYDYIDFSRPVAHAEALGMLQSADVSLILQAPDDDIHIPGKLFEAFGARIPVLALSNPCEVTDLIDQVHGGVHVPHDPEQVADALGKLREAVLSGGKWQYDESEVTQFSAEKSVEKLAALFKDMVS